MEPIWDSGRVRGVARPPVEVRRGGGGAGCRVPLLALSSSVVPYAVLTDSRGLLQGNGYVPQYILRLRDRVEPVEGSGDLSGLEWRERSDHVHV